MITVVVVDDHPMVRSGLRAVCATVDDIEVVSEVGDGRQAIAECVRLRPDVVLMDLELPEVEGIAATREVVGRCPNTAVLVLTMFDDDEAVFAAVGAGASGYLLKGSDGQDVLAAIRAVASGQAVFGPALATRLRTWFQRSPPTPEVPFPELTGRERDILDHLAAGRTNGEIAAVLHLSAKTIANNVSTILNKLQVTQRGQAIVRAREAGLGRPDPAADPS